VSPAAPPAVPSLGGQRAAPLDAGTGPVEPLALAPLSAAPPALSIGAPVARPAPPVSVAAEGAIVSIEAPARHGTPAGGDALFDQSDDLAWPPMIVEPRPAAFDPDGGSPVLDPVPPIALARPELAADPEIAV